ncbi:MAG: hypothetical protein M3N43_07225 [Actinomycetota bacterium]|nr:hypothetical protein [Actinomycetota bacterium]
MDIVELVGAAGEPPAVLVGHDWGGVIACRVAAQRPERVLYVPHSAVMRAHLRWHLSRLRRSD